MFSLLIKRTSLTESSVFSNAWDIALYMLVLLGGLIYSENLELGLAVIETNFSFFAIPIIISKVEVDKKKLRQLFFAFSGGLILASLICVVHSVILFLQTGDIHVFFFYQLTQILDFQPTYFGYYIIAAISFGLYLLYYDPGQFSYRWVLAAIAFLFIVLMLTGGITSFMSILFVLAFFILKYFTEEKTNRKGVTVTVVILMMAGLFVFSYIYKQIDNESARVTDSWERIRLWESAIQANPDALLGVGTGDYKKVLNQFYVDHKMFGYASESLNAHNQFVQIFFSNGLLGLLAMVLLLARPLYLSVKNQNIVGALIFFPFFIYGMSEVFLGRFQGVIFFVLMHQLFIAHYNSSKQLQRIV
ncbi:MAG: O-antigen ligase family protein [Bacteroidetes bacterium]|nr:O-antigen ligase family protein [Bacteroidota bacterium]